MQKWQAIRKYVDDYLNLVYKYYAAHARSYVCTYYSLDILDSNIDLAVLDAGYYEEIGDLSGLRWNKILLLPVYQIDAVQPTFQADERGFGSFEQAPQFHFPNIYNFEPRIHDFMFFDEGVPTVTFDDRKVSSFEIVHFEKATNADITFWRVSTKIHYAKKDSLDRQLSGNFTFFDYEKQIYKTPVASYLYKLLEKNQGLDGNNYFKETSGFYYI